MEHIHLFGGILTHQLQNLCKHRFFSAVNPTLCPTVFSACPSSFSTPFSFPCLQFSRYSQKLQFCHVYRNHEQLLLETTKPFKITEVIYEYLQSNFFKKTVQKNIGLRMNDSFKSLYTYMISS